MQKKQVKFWIKLESKYLCLVVLFIPSVLFAQNKYTNTNLPLLDSNFINDHANYANHNIIVTYNNIYYEGYNAYDSVAGMLKKNFIVIKKKECIESVYKYNISKQKELVLIDKKISRSKKFIECRKKAFEKTNNGMFLQIDTTLTALLNSYDFIGLSSLPLFLHGYNFDVKVKIEKGRIKSFILNSNGSSRRSNIVYRNLDERFPNFYYLYFPFLFRRDCKRISVEE